MISPLSSEGEGLRPLYNVDRPRLIIGSPVVLTKLRHSRLLAIEAAIQIVTTHNFNLSLSAN